MRDRPSRRLSLFGLPAGQVRRKPAYHRLLVEHVTPEYPVRTEARGRVVHQWKRKPSAPHNPCPP